MSLATAASLADDPKVAAKARNVAITTTLLRMGANIGTANRWWALSRPPAMAA